MSHLHVQLLLPRVQCHGVAQEALQRLVPQAKLVKTLAIPR
jgi:hypothetical protein